MSSFHTLQADKATLWSWLRTVISDPNLIATALFCLIGLLTTVNLILRFPDFGAIIAQYNQF
jgi:hypothetical protein